MGEDIYPRFPSKTTESRWSPAPSYSGLTLLWWWRILSSTWLFFITVLVVYLVGRSHSRVHYVPLQCWPEDIWIIGTVITADYIDNLVLNSYEDICIEWVVLKEGRKEEGREEKKGLTPLSNADLWVQVERLWENRQTFVDWEIGRV